MRRKKRKMQQASERDGAILEVIPDMFFVFANDGTILDYKPARDQEPLLPLSDFIGKHVGEILPPDISDKTSQSIEQALLTGKEQVFQYDLPLEGKVRHYEARMIPFGEKEVLAIVRDISRFNQTEKNLQESESRYRRLFENNPLPMYIYDVQTLQILEANAAFENRYGYSRSEIKKISIKDIRPDEEIDRLLPHIRDLDPEMVYTGVWKHMKKDGTVIDVDITSTDFPYQGTRARLVLCSDITEKLRVEEELTESENRYRRLFEDNPMPMLIFEPETLRFLAVNEAAEIHYGWTRHEFLNMTIRDIRPPEDVQAAVKYIQEMDQGLDKVGVRRHRKKDGSVIHVDITSHSLTYRGKSAWLALCQDVTERIDTMEAIRKSEERYRLLADNVTDVIWILDLDFHYKYVTPSVTRLRGYEPDELIGSSLMDLLSEESRKKVREEYGRELQAEKIGGVDPNRSVTLELEQLCKDGSTVWTEVRVKFLRDPQGVAQGLVGVTRDISQKKKAEAEINASLKEKEILLKEVHHRVKNNLQIISGLLNLQAQHITDPGAKEVYKESQNRVITMGLIHEELYQSKDLAQVDFAAYIQNLSSNLFASYGKEHGNVDLVLDAEHVDMIVDTAIPCGLIVNELISNSLKHAFPMEKAGEVRVNFHSTGGGVYQLSVADSGVGLPAGFDFSRTKSLGLQLVTVMTELLGGTIELNQDCGTKFTITFKEYREAGTELH